MEKFHSIVSRRDFVKALGLVGGGLGAAGAAMPMFHDLDEVVSSSNASEKRPWWIKERDAFDPVTPIDWNKLQSFAPVYDNDAAHLTPEHSEQRLEANFALKLDRMEKDEPGYTLRDAALFSTSGLPEIMGTMVQTMMTGIDPLWDGSHKEMIFGKMLFVQMPPGSPKWKGDPEGNSRMMRTLCKFYGASTVAFGEVNEKTRKLICKHGIQDTIEISLEDVDVPYQVPHVKKVIPNKYKYAIIFTINEDLNVARYTPSYIGVSPVMKAYQHATVLSQRISAFLTGIGYGACTSAGATGSEPRAGWGELFGLGEVGRLQHLITPEYGPFIRCTYVLYTDLPVAPTNPIDFGAARFCETCTKCADLCPGRSLRYGERSWDITSADNEAMGPDHLVPERFNNPGIKTWYFNHFACYQTWLSMAAPCGICQGNCVFTKQPIATVHDLVKVTVAQTPIFNSFFTNMDKSFGYKPLESQDWEKWWDEEHPIVGLNY
ncbi:reductive dehalogenase [Dehalococcoides mccartyi]|jgi:reductive dehalogenase|uniref:reductive dehalogenase n=1 Tax=Dehalococcoides mccartyi TaxID=61435 RepID=UPI0003C816BD|nr:reductive dehalogenase [Dehalococcoides mccartyi]AHB12910.1 reductive dehalogenase [Dehalococcoides mccartyi GY50]